jgi:ppGpp synthetase/RelA/SpoT-type nucleotidyltranferase
MGRPLLSAEEGADALRTINASAKVADIALTHLLGCLDACKVSARVYARRHRIKSEDDIIDKVRRKRKIPGKEDYLWTDITDVVGLRFITLYRDDIAPVTECVFSALLCEIEEVQPSPFARELLEEFRLYMANTKPDNDPLAVRLKDFASRHHKKSDKWKYTGPEVGERYSSVHFVTRISTKNGPKIPVEIQIRSVFEDAWGEIDHALLYEPRRLDAPMDWTFLQVERQSNALKKMMDAAADFADAIRSLRAPEARGETIKPTLDTSHYVEQVCKAIKVPASLRKFLMELVSRRENLDALFARGESGAARADYTRLANAFADFLTAKVEASEFLSGSPKGSPRRELIYLARMEEAVCRILSYDEHQVPVAIARLTDIVREFPNHPVAWFRQVKLMPGAWISIHGGLIANEPLASGAKPMLVRRKRLTAWKRRQGESVCSPYRMHRQTT